MADKIKLENIGTIAVPHTLHTNRAGAVFCTTCGAPLTEKADQITYVCSSCRHLILPTDSFCGYCGEALNASSKVEHHYAGGKLSDEDFEKLKKVK